jgi:phytoene desaturase
LHFGLRREHSQLAHHTILFGPRWKELLEDIYHNGVLPEDNALYLHAPSVTDKSMAPEGCSAYYALAVVPNLSKLNIDWSIEKERYKEVIYQQLEERCIPNLREDLVIEKIFTPIDFEKELNSYQGAAFSMEPLLIQSAYFRIHNSDQKIKGLYFTGAGTHPGAGVPGVVNSAKATARIMIDNLKNG